MFRFSSKYFENETSLYYYGYRYKNNERWLNRDPIEERGEINLYVFAINTPINLIDRDGRDNWHGGNNEWYTVSIEIPGLVIDSLDVDKLILISKLLALCPEPNTFKITGWGTICCPDDCIKEANELANAIVDVVKKVRSNILTGGLWGNAVAFFTNSKYGYKCTKWVKEFEVNLPKGNCFDTGKAGNRLFSLRITTHRWIEIYGPDTVFDGDFFKPGPARGIQIDPWESGGETLFPCDEHDKGEPF